MNKRGFTLIELLGVILIISLLVIIVLPKITNSVNNFNPKIDKLTMNMLEEAAKLYVEDNTRKFEEGLYDYSCVPLTELIDKEYLKEGIEISGKDITKTKTFKVTYDNEYKLELVDNNECIVIPDPGLYDENNALLATWDQLVEKGFDIESDFNSSTSSNNINILNSYGNKYKLVVDGSVTKIGNYALYNCKNLIEIILTKKVTSIGASSFDGCSNLANINLPRNLTNIGGSAFRLCTSITEITIPSSVVNIGSDIFAYCDKLKSIVVDENNSVYDSRDNSNAIIETASNTIVVGCKNTVIPNSVTSIGNYAFRYNRTLTNIIIPNSITKIGTQAFYFCNNLTSITIPSSVINIGNRAFSYCYSLESVVVDENNSVYDSRENSNAIIETANNTLLVGCKNTVIPNSVTSIGDYAFYNSSGLTNTIIPNSVTSIGNYAFYSTGLTSITIPSSVINIGSRSFNGCSKLMSIIVDENNTVYDSRENSNALIETASNTLVVGCKNTIIPNSVTSIGDGAFYQSGLTSIMIPNSVISIGNNAFGYSSSLTSITIPNSVTSIGNGTFNGCSKLTTIYYSGSATGSPWGAPKATVVSE